MDSLNDQIPDLEIKTYSGDNYEFKSLEGTIKLVTWGGYQSRQGAYATIDSDKVSDGTAKLSIGGDMVLDNPVITKEHINAYKYLMQHQATIKNSILQVLLKEYKNLQEQYGYEPEDAASIMPDVDNISQFKNLVGLSAVHLLNVSNDNTAYVGYEFGCSWEDEHGLGVMTHRDRVIEIGGADTSFLTWIAERDLDPEQINAEIEASYKLAEERHSQDSKQQQKKP